MSDLATSEDARVQPGGRHWGQRGTVGTSIASRLTFEDIRLAYDGAAAIRGVSFDLEPGEVLCLLGPSGCGKTSLLRVAAGVLRQDSGRVLIDGREIAGPGGFVPPEKRGIGLMFQDYALFPHMTILDNVLFGLAGLPRDAARREALKALGRVGLQHMAGDYPHMLSGGEQQRVALARAIAPRPGVLLMDEPFSGLDGRLRETVREETLAVLRETRSSCLIVTHDPEEAMRLGDRIALMRAGHLVQIGPAAELYSRPVDLAAARFFCDLNEFDGKVEDGAVAFPLGRIAAPAFAGGTDVTVCVRPRGIAVGEGAGTAPGRVVARHFLGEVDLVEIVIDGRPEPVRARMRPGSGLEPGAEVAIGFDLSETLLFAKTGE